MKMETVIECVNKLSTNYDLVVNEKFREERIKLLSEVFKHKLDSSLKSAVEKVLHDENIKKYPTIMQIENYMPILHNQTQEYCDKCERTGYYTVWQYRESISKYYDFAYRCLCNSTTMQNIPALASEMVPVRAHNPHPPNDSRHEDFNNQKKQWDYQRLDAETFKALAYSHKMKSVLKSVN